MLVESLISRFAILYAYCSFFPQEKQEARIQVIAQDLDQAQFVADSLQHLLEERERVLNEELGNADMSNQMICE